MAYDIARSLNNPNIVGNALVAMREGEQHGDRNRLAQLSSEAYSTPMEGRNNLLSRMAAIDPDSAAKQSQAFATMDANQKAQLAAGLEQFARTATGIAQDPDEQRATAAYGQLIDKLASTGKDVSQFRNVPPKIGARMALVQIASTKDLLDQAGLGQGYTLAPGAARFSSDNQQVAAAPERAPEAVRTLEALQQNPELAAFDMQRRAASRPVTNINTGAQENAFQKALGTKDAASFVTMRDQAAQAANTLTQADQLAQILGAQKTGKVQEALAMAGQYFGTDAGANLQSLKGVIQPLVLAQVKQLGSGSGISDADRKFIESGMPGFGNDPRANERVLRIMRQTAQRKIDLYKQADAYVQKNGRLGGFQSPLITPEPPPSDAPRPRAVNQQTGQTVEFDGSQWVPVDGQ